VKKTGIAFALLFVHLAAVWAQDAKLLPVDEAARDPGLFAFRAQLQSAIARRDADAVLSMVDPQIKTGFGGNDGNAAFRKQWGFPGSASRLWSELGTALALGGSFQNPDTFVFPYVYSRWPEDRDAFEHVAVLGTNVNVRSAPKLDSNVLARLSFDVVKLAGQGLGKDWTAIQLPDGRKGYIASRYVRSSVGYRGFLVRKNGAWRLTTFVAGD
jgi:uncharacterized protein YgiM (DUF1202 family)